MCDLHIYSICNLPPFLSLLLSLPLLPPSHPSRRVRWPGTRRGSHISVSQTNRTSWHGSPVYDLPRWAPFRLSQRIPSQLHMAAYLIVDNGQQEIHFIGHQMSSFKTQFRILSDVQSTNFLMKDSKTKPLPLLCL